MGKRELRSFSSFRVAVEDIEFLADAITAQLTTRQEEMFSAKGILKDYQSELAVSDPDPGSSDVVEVATGAAYIQGERAEVTEATEVELSGVVEEDNVVYIEYAQTANSDANATREDDLGAPHTVWFDDGVELVAVPVSEWTDPADKLALALVHWTGTALQITNYETFCSLEAPIGDGVVDTDAIADQAVTGAKIASNSISSAKLQTGSVTGSKLADGAVVEAKLGTGAVATDKLADDAVTTEKIYPLAVTENEISDSAVTEGKIESGAVTAAKIGALAVTEAKIAAEAVTAGKIGPLAVTEAKIGAGAVTETKIGAGAVTEAKIGTGAVTNGKLAAGVDVVPIYDARVEERGSGDAINPIDTTFGDRFYCAAGTTKYKVVTVFRRHAVAGPVNTLYLDYKYEVAGAPSPELTVYLVAWPEGDAPPAADPDDPSFDGEQVSDTHSGAGSGSNELTLDITSREGTGRWVVGIVMKANADSGLSYIADMSIVGVR